MRGSRGRTGGPGSHPGKSEVAIGFFRNTSTGSFEKQLDQLLLDWRSVRPSMKYINDPKRCRDPRPHLWRSYDHSDCIASNCLDILLIQRAGLGEYQNKHRGLQLDPTVTIVYNCNKYCFTKQTSHILSSQRE